MTSSLKWGIILFFAFLLFTIPVSLGTFAELDRQLTITLQSLLTKSLDMPLSLLSLLGSFEVTSLILIFVVYKLKLKKSLIVLFIFGLGMGLELLGKTYIYHPGPPNIYFRYSLDVLFPSAYVQTGHSYPSGHSYRTTFITLLLIFLSAASTKLKHAVKKHLSFSLVLVLLLMLISRVSLGEHWTTDVVGGLLLGASFASLSVFLIRTGFLRSNQVK
jgi:undecaprenyl-diphosphatase